MFPRRFHHPPLRGSIETAPGSVADLCELALGYDCQASHSEVLYEGQTATPPLAPSYCADQDHSLPPRLRPRPCLFQWATFRELFEGVMDACEVVTSQANAPTAGIMSCRSSSTSREHQQVAHGRLSGGESDARRCRCVCPTEEISWYVRWRRRDAR